MDAKRERRPTGDAAAAGNARIISRRRDALPAALGFRRRNEKRIGRNDREFSDENYL